LQEKCGDAFAFLRYNDAEKHSFCCFGSGNNHSVCSPVLAATSPYRGDIFVPQSREGYTKEIIFEHMTLGMACLQKIIPEMQKTCSFQSRSACKN